MASPTTVLPMVRCDPPDAASAISSRLTSSSAAIGAVDQIVEAIDDRQAHQRLGDHGAGHVAGFMAAHPVGHRPQAAVGADQHRILVDLAAKPDMGPADAFECHACPPLSVPMR